MTGADRVIVGGLVAAAIVVAASLVVFAAVSCPMESVGRPCPEAALNRAIVVALTAVGVALLVTPFAFLAEFAAQRSFHHGSWARAARRGLLAGAVVAALAGLRLGDALSVPATIFVLVLAGIAEWWAAARLDIP